jgi:hypothetical protein
MQSCNHVFNHPVFKSPLLVATATTDQIRRTKLPEIKQAINQLVNILFFTDAHTSDIANLAVYRYIANMSDALEKAHEIGPVPPNVRRAR